MPLRLSDWVFVLLAIVLFVLLTIGFCFGQCTPVPHTRWINAGLFSAVLLVPASAIGVVRLLAHNETVREQVLRPDRVYPVLFGWIILVILLRLLPLHGSC